MKSLIVLLTLFIGFSAYASGLPVLHIQPEILDMGSVKEGEEAKGRLFIRNNSESVITITNVETSCGCTVAEPKSRVLAPGAFTELKVTIDSTVKQGDVKKSVHVTDSTGNVAKAVLKLHVTENPHLAREGRGLFDGKCAACHVDPVQGKVTGKAIYDAACLMCHGEEAKGAYAISLRGHDDETAMQYLISHGTGSPQMPGFAKKQGGPLTQKQVFTLSKWLLSLD